APRSKLQRTSNPKSSNSQFGVWKVEIPWSLDLRVRYATQDFFNPASTSIVMSTSSPTAPLNALTPKSWRLIFVVASQPDTVVPGIMPGPNPVEVTFSTAGFVTPL